PLAFRSARTRLETDYATHLITRLVAVNSFYFHLVLGQADLSALQFSSAVRRFSSEVLPGSVVLKPNCERVLLHSSEQDGIRSHLPKLVAFRDQYGDFFEKRRGWRTAAQLPPGADARPFVGPPLPRLRPRDAVRRATGADRPRTAQ